MGLVFETLKLRYSYPRLQWLAITMASVAFLYLSSEEIWKTVDGKPFPEITMEAIFVYTAFFSSITFLIHFSDVKSVITRNGVVIIVSMISMGIDLSLLSLAELVVLWSIQVLPNEPLRIAELLLLGVMPSSLGVATLSSLTADVLKGRISKLRREVHELKRQAEELEKKRKAAEIRHGEFEKKLLKFEEYLEKEKKEGKTTSSES